MTDKEAPLDERAKLQCTVCGRKSWDDAEGLMYCRMTQPSGDKCSGIMRALLASPSLPLPSDPLPEYFMDGVDFQHHLDDDSHGTRVYADLEDLRDRRRCVAQCGIVAVHVTLSRWVQRQDFNAVVHAAESPGQQEQAVLSALYRGLLQQALEALNDAAKLLAHGGYPTDWLLPTQAAIRSRLEPKP